MKHIKKKISRITDELETFCFSIGANDITINIKHNHTDHDFQITVTSDFKEEYRRKVEKMDEILNPIERNAGIEMYWELLGESDMDYEVQLGLISQIITSAKVEIEGNTFNLEIHKKED